MVIELITLLTVYFAVGLFGYYSHKIQNRYHNYLCLSRAYFIMSLIGTIVCGVLAITLFIFDQTALSVVIAFLSIAFAVILAACFGYRIYFDEEKIVYRKYFGKYKTILYSEIKSFKWEFDIIIKTANRKLVIPCYMDNFHKFLETITVKLPPKAKTKIAQKQKVRKFSDSVYRSGEFVFVYILMYVLDAAVCGLTIWAIKNGSDMPSGFVLGFIVFLFAFLAIIPPISIFCAKRAHSSKVCRAIAKLFIREGYLKK